MNSVGRKTRYFIFVKEKDYHNKQRKFREITRKEYLEMNRRRQETVWVTLQVLKETQHAYLLSDSKAKEWVPKSQIVDSEVDIVEGQEVSVELPVWVAEEKGFQT